MLSIAKPRCVNRELIAGLLRFRIHGIPSLPGFFFFFSKKSQILLCHSFDVVLLVEVPLLFVEVVQFLVQLLNEQLEILLTFLDIAVSPELILSNADVTQRIPDFIVA